ncbi:MAG: 2-hydroxychromene-2-carboxylate isomerase [Gammaproteobacteria bacterium]|nr:2-hydroxychromene-2-carboxylate isomerase [Gammaproteobacteria bacterium]MYF50740.1 2-hydroxychromene-2-carboxylate isomerase [Gammaproteobacteria bacterium]
MNPERLKTRIRSQAMRLMTSEAFLRSSRRRARLRRRLSGEAQAVHYFHQVDDPYSHLAVQKLDALKAAYGLPFKVHLVSGPAAAFQGSSEHFEAWALKDARSVAADYGVAFDAAALPQPVGVDQANDRLEAHLDAADFAAQAFAAGQALWSGALQPAGSSGMGQEAVRRGDALRERLGHYLGGMFYFDGEWFWGIDRIRLLEARLLAEGLGGGEPCVPEPVPTDTSGLDASHIVLEYFPSLRSPYTAVGHQRVLDLIARSGVTVKLRPVMPMMMRGVPAPRPKQRYILTDAAREARAHGVPFGRVVDPFGEPVRRAFALFPGAVALDAGMAFVTAYLSAAWAEAIDISTEAGLRQVAANAGLDWSDLQAASRDADWSALLDDNLNAMLDAGLWGVPSFRVTGGADGDAYACWGQDRIWRVENEITKRAQRVVTAP